MKEFEIFLAATTAIVLFVFGLENFSKEIQKVSGERFRKFLAKATKYPTVGLGIGGIVTALIQSSSATSVITIGLVNAGILSFRNSVGVIFGSNIGTTVTAQLIAFKLTAFAPVLIILGFFLSFSRSKYSIFAKSLFYFGFVFFSLDMISHAVEPLKNDIRVTSFLLHNQNPLLAILAGAVVTALVQSSSVTTGLAVIFTQQGLLSLENAIPIVMGANIGTTITASFSIIRTDISAKKTAVAHFLFNMGGVLMFIPFIGYFTQKVSLLSSNPAIALAQFHLIFNLTTSFVFLAGLKPFVTIIDKILGEGKMDFERFIFVPLSEEHPFEVVKNELLIVLDKTYLFLQENYNLVTLSIETNYKGIFEAAEKRIEYIDYLKSEIIGYFSQTISKVEDEKNSQFMVKVISLFEYEFQLHDSIKDLTKIKGLMASHFVELQSDLILLVRELSSRTLALFRVIAKARGGDEELVRKHANELQEVIDHVNRDILKLMSQPKRKDAGSLIHIITYSQRLKDKLLNFHYLLAKYQIDLVEMENEQKNNN